MPRQLWKARDNIKVDDVVKGSENWTESPLKKFFDIIEKKISSSKDVVHLHRKLSPSDCESGNLDAIEDECVELFFTKPVQIQTVQDEDWVYTGTVNKFGKPEGLGRMVFTDNRVHEGTFRNGQATGYGRRLEPNGSVFEGLYFQGIRQGRGILVDKSGVERKGNWNHYGFEGQTKVPVAAEE